MVLEQPTRTKRRKALEKLPNNIYTTFATVVKRIQESPKHANLGLQVLMWLHFARRPFKVNELQHALSVEPDQLGFDADNVPSKNLILASCLGLVIVDNETSTVRFVHYSLEEYFQKHTNENFPNGPSMIAETCLTYVNFDEISKLDSSTDYRSMRHTTHEREKTYPFLNYAASYWSTYATEQSNSRVNELALKLLDYDVTT